MRSFEDKPAARERVPLLIGLMGPSGGGKTYSALRLATGIQSVTGGDIFVVDTEARRALHYADQFNFRHVPFGAPFSPLDYLAAIQHCERRGASVVVIDSMSHEHEGPGGVLDWHDRETKRLAPMFGGEAKATFAAWGAPKQARRALINGILQLPINVISCFRAKEKLKLNRGKDPQPMGWMPIAGEEFLYEQTVCALLMPGAGGVPTWQPSELGEQQMVKLPGWARETFSGKGPLSEDIGARLAQWAAGTVVRSVEELLEAYGACSDPATFGSLERERRAMWRGASPEAKLALKAAVEAATDRLKAAEAPEESGGEASEERELAAS